MPENPIIPPIPDTSTTNPILPTPPPLTPPLANPPTSSGSSKKGLLITGVIALSAVVILGVLAFSIQNSTKEATTPSQAVTEKPTPTPVVKTLVMEITGVNDNEVVGATPLKLTGNTNLPATVTITGGKEDLVIDSTGSFSVEVALNEGENPLIFTAIDSNDNQKVLTRNVFYTTERAAQ